jgi:hypothetical protein
MCIIKRASSDWLLAASLTVAACTLPGSGVPLTNPSLIATSLVLATCALPAIGTPLANPFPRSFTDDPFVDDEKFIEIGKSLVLIISKNLFYCDAAKFLLLVMTYFPEKRWPICLLYKATWEEIGCKVIYRGSLKCVIV